jgi:phosphate transport system permease protein
MAKTTFDKCTLERTSSPIWITIQVPSLRKKDVHWGDWIFGAGVRTFALGLVILLILISSYLFQAAWPAFKTFQWEFFTRSMWDPVQERFGIAPVIYGTLMSSLIALLIATPVSIGAALFLEEYVPPKISKTIGFLIEMLTAIPSVVYGLWGFFVLVPFLRTTGEPFLQKVLGFLPIFQGTPFGVGMLAAGLILSFMITPTLFTLSREIFKTTPSHLKEAALALGATRWEMIRIAVLNNARSGLGGALLLALGRALGETMAVTMVIGNRSQISSSLFAPSQSMASIIANEYVEATSDLHLAALMGVGLSLFFITFITNCLGNLLLKAKGQIHSERN